MVVLDTEIVIFCYFEALTCQGRNLFSNHPIILLLGSFCRSWLDLSYER